MGDRRLRKLRERAFEAGILGSSKMREHELLEALAQHRPERSRSIVGLLPVRRTGRRV